MAPQLFDNNANSLRLKPLEEIEKKKNNKDNAISGGLSAAVIAGAYGLPYLYSTALPAVSTYAMAHPTIAAGVGAAGTTLSKARPALGFARKVISAGGPKLFGLAKATVHPIEQTSAAINAFRTAPVSSVASTMSTGLSLNALKDAYVRVDEDYITPVKEYIYPCFRDKVYPIIKNTDINWYNATKNHIWPFAKKMSNELYEISKAKARSRRTGEPISSSLYENKSLFNKWSC